jgi:hypothetical protein
LAVQQLDYHISMPIIESKKQQGNKMLKRPNDIGPMGWYLMLLITKISSQLSPMKWYLIAFTGSTILFWVGILGYLSPNLYDQLIKWTNSTPVDYSLFLSTGVMGIVGTLVLMRQCKNDKKVLTEE